VAKKSFVFPRQSIDRLEKLAQAWRLESGTSVLRVSLAVFEDLTDAIQRGDQVLIRSADGEEKFYHPLMARAPNVPLPGGSDAPRRG
jgi:hypothetical protein